MNVAAAMGDLYTRVRSCQGCPLARTRTLSVPGEGSLDAEVMFIGEAPGANEDRQGRPFVGAAGTFLSELLAAAGLRREQVYICNVLKCRPPDNRDPQPEEIEACRDFLDEQIDLVDPLLIVTLGRFSMAKFFPRQSISRIHGQPWFSAGRCYVPMYHPAAALHRGDLRQVMLDDFATLPAILARLRDDRGGAQPAPPPPPRGAPAAAGREPSPEAAAPARDTDSAMRHSSAEQQPSTEGDIPPFPQPPPAVAPAARQAQPAQARLFE